MLLTPIFFKLRRCLSPIEPQPITSPVKFLIDFFIYEHSEAHYTFHYVTLQYFLYRISFDCVLNNFHACFTYFQSFFYVARRVRVTEKNISRSKENSSSYCFLIKQTLQ